MRPDNRIRVNIDPNVRTANNETYSALADCSREPVVNEWVVVVEPESGLVGEGRVTDIDPLKGLVYIDVPWPKLTVEPLLRTRAALRVTRHQLDMPEHFTAWDAIDDLYDAVLSLTDVVESLYERTTARDGVTDSSD